MQLCEIWNGSFWPGGSIPYSLTPLGSAVAAVMLAEEIELNGE